MSGFSVKRKYHSWESFCSTPDSVLLSNQELVTGKLHHVTAICCMVTGQNTCRRDERLLVGTI